MKSKTIQAMAIMALAASVLGAHAQTSTNGTPTDSHVLQGNFEAGGSPVFLASNSNADRCGTGGGGTAQRVNQPIFSFDLPDIPAGESLSAVTFSFKMLSQAVSGAPLEFDMVISLMDHAAIGEFSGADFVEGTAPVNSPLADGIVLAQLAVADVSNNETIDVSLTGAALAQVAGLYGAGGTPSQGKLWFRASTSTNIDTSADNNANNRFQFDDAGHSGPNISSLELNWASVPVFIADPIVKANVTWGSDYALLTQSLAGSATNSAGATMFYDKVGGPDWLVVATNGDLSGIADVVGTNEFSIKAIVGAESTIGNLQIVVDALGNPPVFTININERADGAFGLDYATLSQTLDGSATDADFDTLIYSRAGGGPGWLNVASNGALSGVCDVLGTNTFPIQVTDGNGNFDTASLVIFVQTVGSAPVFTVDPIVKADVVFGEDYALFSETLDGSATDADLDTLTYSKDSGPGWLNIASNGALTGVAGTIGTNSYTVAVNDGNGNIDAATLLIYVAPPPQPNILVGWDKWTTGTSVATVQSNGFTGSATITGWNLDAFAGCTDGTWGTSMMEPTPSILGAGNPDEGLRVRGEVSSELQFTISNTSGEDVDLGTFHFDALNKTNPDGPKKWNLEVLTGSDITVGAIITNDLAYVAGTANLADYDVDLTGLADHTLEAGGSVVFRLEFTEGTDGISNRMDVDNVALSEVLDTGPVEQPVMGSEVSGGNMTITWTSEGSFKLQTRPNLAFGDWEDVPGATSSPAVVPATNDVEFLRLIEQ